PDVTAVVPDEVVTVAGQLVPTGVSRIGTKLSTVAKIDGVDQRVDADVAVVDTGIDATHPDLNVVGGVNCSSSDRTAWQDDNHHGTHVAGTIGALDNGIGVVGVAPGVRLWAVRILDASGSGLLSWYVCGLDWIAAQRDPADPSRPLIEAVNMSVTKWGSDDHDCGLTNKDILHQAICRVTAAGITVVAAAANDSGNAAKRVPASYHEVITVSALADTDGKPGGLGGNRCYSWGTYDKDDTFADFSNYGADVDIIAPGKCIWSTLPDNLYGYSSGTSMAAPAVTGAVALYRASRPWTKPSEVRTALQYLGNLNWFTSTDPDSTHEKLLDVSRIGPAGDFTVAVGTPVALGEAGGTTAVPVTLTRTPTHFETVTFAASAGSGITGAFSKASLRGFTANASTLTITVPPQTPAATYQLTVTGTEGPHVHTATVAVVVENDLPTARPASAAIAYRGSLGKGTAPLLVSWPAATDPTSAIAAYEVQRSEDWAGWRDDVLLGGGARSVVRAVAVKHTYRFRIRARDAVGNWSPWVVGPAMRIGIVEDTSDLIHYSTSWRRTADAWASDGTRTWTGRNGATARLTVAARHLAIVGPVSANRGWAGVYVDGVYQATVSFYSATTASGRVVWSKTFDVDAVRTLELRAITTASRPRVDLDAILIGR
ncbi:MAG TPA: S8 family serine peptidase, partial [Candidatus Limnocylindrales bacterium]|nr:S8 family serine peptidase [Candidatus Limnocylindrales bacterium]